MPKPRQMILIMTDSQRWDMINCYRNTGLQTPSLDRLAAGGVRFERAYTCQPLCGPARASLFTGTWPHNNGSWSNNQPLGEGCRSVGQRLCEAGVHAAYIGKWHLDNTDYFGRGVAPQGWDKAYWYDMRNYLEELSPEDRVRSRREKTIQEGVPEEFTFGRRCSNRAIDFLKRHGNEEFFLVVSYDEPHGPCLCPKKYYDMYKDYEFPVSPNVHDALADKPEHHRVWAGTRLREDSNGYRIRRPDYFGCNTFVDSEIGRVLDAIDADAPDALAVYTSDHGHMQLSHRLHIKGPAMYDEIARIPFILRWPDHSPAGAVCPHLVSHIDVTPTVLEFFGVPDPGTLDGASMLGAFRDPTVQPRDAVFVEFGRYGANHDGFGGFEPIRCIVRGHYKTDDQPADERRILRPAGRSVRGDEPDRVGCPRRHSQSAPREAAGLDEPDARSVPRVSLASPAVASGRAVAVVALHGQDAEPADRGGRTAVSGLQHGPGDGAHDPSGMMPPHPYMRRFLTPASGYTRGTFRGGSE